MHVCGEPLWRAAAAASAAVQQPPAQQRSSRCAPWPEAHSEWWFIGRAGVQAVGVQIKQSADAPLPSMCMHAHGREIERRAARSRCMAGRVACQWPSPFVQRSVRRARGRWLRGCVCIASLLPPPSHVFLLRAQAVYGRQAEQLRLGRYKHRAQSARYAGGRTLAAAHAACALYAPLTCCSRCVSICWPPGTERKQTIRKSPAPRHNPQMLAGATVGVMYTPVGDACALLHSCAACICTARSHSRRLQVKWAPHAGAGAGHEGGAPKSVQAPAPDRPRCPPHPRRHRRSALGCP